MSIPAAQIRWLRILAQGLLLTLMFAAPCVSSASAQNAGSHKRVLIVLSNDSFTATQAVIERAVRSTLKEGSPVPVEAYSEYVGNTRADTDYEKEFVALLRRKYVGKKFDLILTIGRFPTSVMVRSSVELFPGVPIVFLTIDRGLVAGLYPAPNLTGVWGEMKFKPNLELALALHPETKRVVVIQGVSETDAYWATRLQEDFRGYQSSLEFSYLTGLTSAEVRKTLGELPPATIVFFVSSVRDKAGNVYESPDFLGEASQGSTAPIYGTTEAHLGKGIVGGTLLGFEALGVEGGRVGLRVLAGEKPEAIAPHGVPSVPMFDWRELKRWNIHESSLPAGSIVRFRQPSFWDQYKWYVLLTLAALLVETALIARLWFTQTKRRQAEKETERHVQLSQQAHRRLQEIVSNVPGMVWETVIDPRTKERRTTFISDYVRTILGYTPEEWLAEAPGLGLRLMVEEDRERAAHAIDATIETGKDTVSQYRCRAKDGRIVWLESYLSPMLNQKGETEGLRGVTLDITERKLGEEVVRKTEEKDVAILEAIPDLMFLQTRDGVYLDLHFGDPDNLIVPPKEYLGKNMREILPPELAEKFFDYFQQAIETQETQIVEYDLTLNGQHRWYESRLVSCGENILSVVRDITERREAELALSESERRLRLAQQAARVGTWEWDFRAGESIWSDMIWELLGLEEDDGPASAERFVEFIHPDDRERAWNKVKEVIANGDEYDEEFRIVQPSGQVLWLSSKGRVFRSSDGTAERMIGVNIDITQRKLAEESARQVKQKDTAILNAIPDLMFLQTREGVFLDYHANREKDLFAPPAAFMGKNMRDVLPADLSRRFFDCFARLEQNPEPQVVEYSLPRNGTEMWYECRIVRSGENVLSVVRDITEQRNALYEQRKSEEKFAKAFRANPQPMSLTILKTGCYLDVNDSFLEVSGYRRDEVIGHTSLELKIWENADARVNFVREVEEKGSVVNVETVLRAKDEARHILLSSAEIVELGGERCLLVASSDITERKAAQAALQESEARFRNMADTAPVLIWMSDTNNLCTYINQQWLDFTGRTIGQELGRGWTEGIHPDDVERCLEIYAAAFERGEPFKLEYQLRRADGTFRWVFDTGTPRFSPTGKFLGYIGSCVDITDRKQSEEAVVEAHNQLVIAHAEVSRLKNELEAENIYLREELRSDQMMGEMVGESDAIKYVVFKVNHVAVTDSTVLITGETGTGKELVARAIHMASLRNDRTFITVNCAALPATLIESELFGHEKGAFTGAAARKLGRFELAHGGTIFLDEIGELPLESQVKLLRVLQESEIERLGGSKAIKVDVRIIAATNRNLKEEIEKGTFREDLWYRLNVFPITVPPLRQRKEDIPLLVEHFVSHYAKKFGKTITSISPRTMQNLEAYTWPGNIRELTNVIERAVIYAHGDVLHVVDLSESPREQAPAAIKSLEQIEREYILNILEQTAWRIEGPRGAAKLLGLNPSTLRTRMIKLGIHKQTLTASH